MLFIAYTIWTLLFFSFIFILTSISTGICSWVFWYISKNKKFSYAAIVLTNLLIIIPAHLFYAGQFKITNTIEPTYKTGQFDFTFYLGFILYLFLISSYSINNFVIDIMNKKQENK